MERPGSGSGEQGPRSAPREGEGPAAAPSAAFWDARTAREREDEDPALLGTVTDAAAVARLRDRLERAHLARAVPLRGDERVLDLGGGAGRLALWIAPRVREVTLVDASEALLAVARARAAREGLSQKVRVVHASALDFLREDAGRYDLVLVSGLATHLDDAELEALADEVAAHLAPGGRLALKEPVTTDGVAREDRREGGYVARFRPRERYAEVFGRRQPLLYQQATLSHPIPFFLGGTEEAAASTTGWKEVLLERAAPLWERLDPTLLALETALRGSPGLAWLLAPVPVLQDLYVFGPPSGGSPRVDAEGEAEAERTPALSVVVIAYREEECLASVVDELVARLAREGLDFELVLVDDGSDDGTLAIMQRLAARDARLRVVPLSPNRGIGGALRAGFDAARGAHVTWVPADGQIDPGTVVELYRRRAEAPMLTTVYVARDDAFYRHAISQTLNTLIRWRTGTVAKSGGNYLFARTAWERHAPRDDDTMMISTAFRARLREAGEPIVEVPIRARARVAGSSKVLNPRTILRTLAAALRG